MVVKGHELVVHEDRYFIELAEYIQDFNENPNFLLSSSELIKSVQDIINCLARAHEHEDHLWPLLTSVQEYILRIVNTFSDSVRHDVVAAILHKFYSVISDPQTEAGPAITVVLVALAGSGEEAILSATRWWVQQNENGPASAGLKAALSCLYSWMPVWHHTLTLGDWVMSFIKALEENEKYDLLIEVSLNHIEQLFMALNDPEFLSHNVTDVIFRVLASLRESSEALDRISPHISGVLTNLAAERGQWSRHLLQYVVDISTTMINQIYSSIKEREKAQNFKNKHSEAISSLERHMTSRRRSFVKVPQWRAQDAAQATAKPQIPINIKKVGLLNLGNTCYINSVIQALLVTRHFSNHVMLRMTRAPYWAKLGILFAKMIYSVSTELNPHEFFSVVRPPFSTMDNQEDSSEFLGFLLLLLQSYEHIEDPDFDYSRPAVINEDTVFPNQTQANRHSNATQESSTSSTNDLCIYCDNGSNNSRSVSPRPGSSACGSNSNSRKRLLSEAAVIPKKRQRKMESHIDDIFGGILMTRIQCTVCRSSSLSRDMFRDLQLAYPDKAEGKQHTVQNLLEYYCSMEKMSGSNKYSCHDCGGLRDAEKCVLIESTPKYLVLVLKNFKFHPNIQLQTKLMFSTYHNPIVTLPTVRSVSNNCSYKLYAAVIHEGTMLDHGHYYTVAKDNGQWHVYNDKVVSAADENYLSALPRSHTPYILFYRRADIEESVAPSMEELPALLQDSVTAHNKDYEETARQCRTRP